MGSIGPLQIVLVIVVALLLFGGRGRISSIMGDMAKGVRSFRKGLADDDEPKSVDKDDLVNVTPKKDESKASS
ncbi:twin-arginine translocase TatA/TatE family subunit [Hyphomonas sp.]|uniref:twin-arginine translocase TatA/TatE family subunit n=1 Tax=Hyphomonas sp. TaxID=87 RepID=UPI0032ECF89D|tara:strand:+ start:10706 stop:10924 length:219 start_codon:yes stop_codon:yes gene_type:complete